MAVHNACVLSTLLHGSESWALYSTQENRLNAVHVRCLRHIIGISRRDRVPDTEVFSRAKSVSLVTPVTLLRQRRLRWLGHVRPTDDGRLPKDILYGELATPVRRMDDGRRPKDILYGELATYVGWMMEDLQNTSCTESCSPEREPQDALQGRVQARLESTQHGH